MRVTVMHPDRPHIQVLLDGVPLDGCVDADTIGGYAVVRDRAPIAARPGDLTSFKFDNGSARMVYGKVELIDKRTGKPYDELYQVAEAAALQL